MFFRYIRNFIYAQIFCKVNTLVDIVEDLYDTDIWVQRYTSNVVNLLPLIDVPADARRYEDTFVVDWENWGYASTGKKYSYVKEEVAVLPHAWAAGDYDANMWYRAVGNPMLFLEATVRNPVYTPVMGIRNLEVFLTLEFTNRPVPVPTSPDPQPDWWPGDKPWPWARQVVPGAVSRMYRTELDLQVMEGVPMRQIEAIPFSFFNTPFAGKYFRVKHLSVFPFIPRPYPEEFGVITTKIRFFGPGSIKPMYIDP